LKLAEHPGLSSRTQCQLVVDPDKRVKLALLEALSLLNPLSIPAQQLLRHDPDYEVQFALESWGYLASASPTDGSGL